MKREHMRELRVEQSNGFRARRVRMAASSSLVSAMGLAFMLLALAAFSISSGVCAGVRP